MSDEVLKLRGVSVRRETSLLLRNVDWTAHENERWIVIAMWTSSTSARGSG